MKLRNYQQNLLASVYQQIKEGKKRPLIQSPTGSGKSLILKQIVIDFISKRNQPVLLICHKIELLNQLVNHLQSIDIDPGVIGDRSVFKRELHKQVQVGSIQALLRCKLPKLPDFGLIIIDEAHHCHAPSYARIFKHYQEAFFIGLTATPIRNDGRGLNILAHGVDGFDCLVSGIATQELIDLGYLSPFKIYRSEIVVDAEQLGIKSRNGDYKQDDLAEACGKIILAGDIVETWQKQALNKKTILYPASVELSKKYVNEFQEASINAAHIDASTSKQERAQIIEAFHQGEILILSQHSIVIEGVDVPDVEVVQLARPTKSLSVFWQIIGRSLRIAPGKQHAIIIDHTTTSNNLPWPTDEIDWQLEAVSLPKKAKHAVCCRQCKHIFRLLPEEQISRLATCPSCKLKFLLSPAGNGEEGQKEIEIVILQEASFSEMSRVVNPEVWDKIEKLFEEAEKNSYKKGWIGYKALEIPDVAYPELMALAMKLGYKPGWAFHALRRINVG